MGNAGVGRFVDPAIPPLFRDRLIGRADVITPNHFELNLLTGVEDVLEAAHAARALGPETVLVTSVEDPGSPEELSMLAITGQGAWRVRTPRLPGKVGGSGDVTAALFAAHLLDTADPALALARTASSVFELLAATHDAGSAELLLVECQELYPHPRMQFEVERVS